jgi:hypothetical protein
MVALLSSERMALMEAVSFRISCWVPARNIKVRPRMMPGIPSKRLSGLRLEA